MSEQAENELNRLESVPVGKLLKEFAVPSIIAMLVSSLYNLVDQFFIGHTVGALGNAATNIQFPLSIACTAVSLLFGIGGATSFNLSMGRARFDEAEKKRAGDFMGNAMALMLIVGIGLLLLTQLFLTPMLRLFGSPADVLPYAAVYTRIVSFGFPFLIFSTGCGSLLRADGRPRAMMISNLTGALINTCLDAAFLLIFHWGMAGAAFATIIGQVIAASMTAMFMVHARTVHLTAANFRLHLANVKKIISLGMAQFINQVALMIVQIVMNNSLKYYGSLSVYGEATPIAVAGIISKVNTIYTAFIIGISQGLQPIIGYNYGARRYDRVKKTFNLSLLAGLVVSIIAFVLFFFFPRSIIDIFGEGSESYYAFAVRYFRVYLFFTFLNFVQPISSNAFTSMDMPLTGAVMSLTRQILFLLPLLLILPLFLGIDGILYAGPAADLLAAAVCFVMISREFRKPQYAKNADVQQAFSKNARTA